MAKRTYSSDARGRILDAAKMVFAKKGFDGSRVDEIAKTAKVPKSLIYYHFKGKDAILDELLNACLSEFRKILTGVGKSVDPSEQEALPERIRTVYLAFLEEHEDLIRIISMEALKKNSKKTHLVFKFVESFMEIEGEHRALTGQALTEEARSERMVTEFFSSFIPVTLFSCFRNAWADYFNIEQETLAQQFLSAYDATYGVYRRKQ
ncbi:MAG: TetR/AcrR family transcriptional regulator [bacterium]|nr:TetR/AcrR family transcriptional regulator [bacterium]